MKDQKNDQKLKITKPRTNLHQNSKDLKNIFAKKPIRQRSSSYSPQTSFDNLGFGQRQRDEKNAHAKQEAYGKMLQIDSYKTNINQLTKFQDLFEGFTRITKNHIQWSVFTPKRALTQTGKIILSNGNFFVVLIQILKQCKYICIDYVVQKIQQKHGSKITQNKQEFVKLINQTAQQGKVKEQNRKTMDACIMTHQFLPTKISQVKTVTENSQTSGRKSILKKSSQKGKSVSFNPEIQYPDLDSLNNFVLQVKKEEAQKQLAKQKLNKIKEIHGFLLDSLQINDIYEQEEYEIVGILDQIQHTYAILLIKQKPKVQPPSYVKTRKSYSKREEFQRQIEENKVKKEILCIAVMKDMQNFKHDGNLLKKIEQKYQNLCFFNIKNYSQCFMNNLPCESIVKESSKIIKQEKKQENKIFQKKQRLQIDENPIQINKGNQQMKKDVGQINSTNKILNQGFTIISSTVGPNLNIRRSKVHLNQNPIQKINTNIKKVEEKNVSVSNQKVNLIANNQDKAKNWLKQNQRSNGRNLFKKC